MNFVTLGRGDAEFERYLLGRIPGKSVVPVRTVNPNTSDEVVTFRVSEKVTPPAFWWLASLRLSSLAVISLPVLFAALVCWQQGLSLDQWDFALTLIGVILLGLAGYLFSDYSDHKVGHDRIVSYAGSRSIQQGFVSAYQVLFWARCCFFLSLVLGSVVVLRNWALLMWLGPVGVFLAVEYASDRLAIKYRMGSELAVFLLFGPILTLAAVSALRADIDLSVVIFAVIWGLLVATDQVLRNFCQCMFYEKAGTQSLVRTLGFEKSRLAIVGSFFLVTLTLAIWGLFLEESILAVAAFFSVMSFFLSYWLFQIQSPVSSKFSLIQKLGRTFLLGTGLAILFAKGWAIWM